MLVPRRRLCGGAGAGFGGEFRGFVHPTLLGDATFCLMAARGDVHFNEQIVDSLGQLLACSRRCRPLNDPTDLVFTSRYPFAVVFLTPMSHATPFAFSCYSLRPQDVRTSDRQDI